MELRQLRYYRAVAEMLHFGRAAEALRVAQPAITRQIQALEAELGVELFDRTRKRVSLTEAGEVFLEGAKRVLAAVDAMPLQAQRAARGEVGRLTVAFVGSATYGPLPAVLSRFRTRLADVDLQLFEMDTTAQRAGLLDGRIDVAFNRAPLHDAEVISEALMGEPIIVALPQKHPLAGEGPIALSALADEPMLVFPQGDAPAYADTVQAACLAAGFRPRVAQQVAEMQTAISLVSAGFGICLVPSGVRQLRRPGVVYRALAEPSPMTELLATYRRDNRSPVLAEFLRAARAESATQRG